MGGGIGPDGFQWDADDAYAHEHQVLSTFYEETLHLPFKGRHGMDAIPSAARILDGSPRQRARTLVALMTRLYLVLGPNEADPQGWERARRLKSMALRSASATGLLELLLKSRPAYEPEDVQPFCEGYRLAVSTSWAFDLKHGSFARAFSAIIAATGPMPAPAVASIRAACSTLHSKSTSLKERRTSVNVETSARLRKDGDWTSRAEWADRIRNELAAMNAEERSAWEAFFRHASTLKGSKPSIKWSQVVRPLRDAVGKEAFVSCAAAWLPPATASKAAPDPQETAMLLGLGWSVAEFGGARAASVLSQAAEPAVAHSLPGLGVGLCAALAAVPELEGVHHLVRMREKFRKPSQRKLVQAALRQAAQASGIPVEDLMDRFVPTFGLDANGIRTTVIDDTTARMSLDRHGRPGLEWIRANGRSSPSPPATVRKAHAEAVKSLKREAKELGDTVAAYRRRFERAYIENRVWEFSAWRVAVLEHPVLGAVARRLIWRVESPGGGVDVFTIDGRLIDIEGREVLPESAARVRLWHPLDSGEALALAWRRRIESLEVVQPFKQAHRELYLLTDAEKATRTYSNRFSAHILRQHQLRALCVDRGWKYNLQGAWDGGGLHPMVQVPAHGLRAEFWIELVLDDHMSESGIVLHVATDQVRFYRDGEFDPIPLEDVPRKIFSEVMRDVDLYVGVCTIGNDPTWADRGEAGAYRTYWTDYSTAELGVSAKVRKEALERLIPRLAIANRCSFTDRYLVVQGDQRAYRIHLGSGNILMQPDDVYLCIQPARAQPEDSELFLPFEGDHLLSVILSKAFLLAADREIRDETILRQIRR